MSYYMHSSHLDYESAEHYADDLKGDTQTENDVSVIEFFPSSPGGWKFAVVVGTVPETDDTEVQYVA